MPGDRWMIRGPQEYVPSVEVEVVSKQKAIPLDENEGIYVRDIKTGKVGSRTQQLFLLYTIGTQKPFSSIIRCYVTLQNEKHLTVHNPRHFVSESKNSSFATHKIHMYCS